MSRVRKAADMLAKGELWELFVKSLRFLFKIPYSFVFAGRIKALSTQDVESLVNFMYECGFNLITPAQVKAEITGLGRIMIEHKPKNILEIGTANGGSLFLFCQLADPAAKIVSLDLPWGNFGGGYPLWKKPLYRSFVKGLQKLYLIRADSHKAESLARIESILQEEKLDFLFIDGDHTYEGVKHDFELYSPLVRSGGIIAMHDICRHHDFSETQVEKFWEEIKDGQQYQELVVDRNQKWAGIGVIYKQ